MEKITKQGALCSACPTKYNPSDQVTKIEMGRACNMDGDSRDACRVLVRKTERRRPLGRLRRRWEDNIKIYILEVVWEPGLDQSGSGYGQAAGCCECGNELSGSIKYGSFLK